jgi:hypothetical protein
MENQGIFFAKSKNSINNDCEFCFFNVKNMDGLKIGDIFYKKHLDGSESILQEYEHLDKEYLANVANRIEFDEPQEFSKLISKLL